MEVCVWREGEEEERSRMENGCGGSVCIGEREGEMDGRGGEGMLHEGEDGVGCEQGGREREGGMGKRKGVR